MSKTHLKQMLFMEQWDKLSLRECEEVARSLDEQLPPTFRFHQVETHTCGLQRRNVAFFEWSTGTPNHGNAFFVFIPGGQFLLGYDREYLFVPTFEQSKSWREETELESGMRLSQYLETCLTPLRSVTVEPFLLEVLATDLSLPRTYHKEWGMWIYEGKLILHADVLQYIQEDGFRF